MNELMTANTSCASVPIFFTVTFMSLLYYGLTIYVNNGRQLRIATYEYITQSKI